MKIRYYLKRYVLGLCGGVAATLYGLVALMAGQAFLPGVQGNEHFIGGRSGVAMALSYLLGGVYLFLRLFLGEKTKKSSLRYVWPGIYNLLLIGLIVALIYVITHVGTAK
jgi:hypothetical protein